jgi:hypothetical protein
LPQRKLRRQWICLARPEKAFSSHQPAGEAKHSDQSESYADPDGKLEGTAGGFIAIGANVRDVAIHPQRLINLDDKHDRLIGKLNDKDRSP